MSDIKENLKSEKSAAIRALKGIGAADFARLLVSMTALVHLSLTQIHVNALLKLENEICGLVMFLFVLAGLLALFEAVRFKRDKAGELILLLSAIITAAALGGVLVSIYVHAILYQRSLKTADVYKAVWLSGAVLVAYLISFLSLIADKVKRRGKTP